MRSRDTIISLLLLTALVTFSGCSLFDGVSTAVGLTDRGTVIVRRAQIRSSYAVVAADLLEVKRGDKLVITEEVEFEKVLWYHVRAEDDDQTEGWIEAQNVITETILDKSRKIAEEHAGRPPQAAGQLRAKSNLRLSPELNDENILYKLDSDSTFQIISWEFVPKVQDAADVDDSSKGTQRKTKKSKDNEAEGDKDPNAADKLDNKYDIWYRVQLDGSVSPAPAGWLFGRQVQLQIPTEITFYVTSERRFVAWYRLDETEAGVDPKLSPPGSYLILTRSSVSKAIDNIEPEFDGIMVLVFDKYDQNYYTAYRTSGEIWGRIPMTLDGEGDNKSFTLNLRNSVSGQMEKRQFFLFRDKNRIKIRLPEDFASFETRRSR